MPNPAPSTVLEFDQTFYYSTTKVVTANALAESLVGIDALFQLAEPILEGVLSIKIDDVEVRVTGIEIGSYKDSLIVRLVLGKGRDLEANLEKIRRAWGLKDMTMKKLIAVVVLAIAGYAAYQFLKPGSPQQITIINSFNQIGGTNLTGQQVVDLVDGLLNKGEKEKAKKNLVKLVNPGGEKHDGEIILNEDQNLKVPAPALAHVPVRYEAPEPSPETVQELTGVLLTVRSADLDRPQQGWEAIAQDVSEKRVPLHVMPEVPINSVPIGRYFIGNITVVFKSKPGAHREPKLYLLHAVEPDEPTQSNKPNARVSGG